MLSEPRTAIILRYIVASSSWRSPVIAVNQAWNFIVRPSVSSVTTAEFFRRCHLEKSSCSNEFDCRSFIKHTPWAVCFLIVTFVNLRLFMSHDLAGVLWIFHFRILSLDLKRSKQKSWLRPVELFRFVNYFRLESDYSHYTNKKLQEVLAQEVKRKQSISSRVSPYTSFVLELLPACFTTE